MSPLAAIPEANTTAAESFSLDACARSSLTQQFISQPKKLIGSWGMFSARRRLGRYINGVKLAFPLGEVAVSAVEANNTRRKLEVER